MAYKPPPEPREIVKVKQSPIRREPNPPLFICGKSRRNLETRLRSRFESKTLVALGLDAQGYFEAEWHHGNQTWIIYDRVEKQAW